MPTLTIFTPAYNRAHTIGRTYESFLNQTCHDFEWLIVDDGSSDNTRQLVESWLDDNGKVVKGNCLSGRSQAALWLRIRYIYQENQGMHGAHNTAYENISTELNTCIDSDDYMPANAVEKIVTFWNARNEIDRNKYAGIIGLDIDDKNRKVIGTPFPDGMKSTTLGGYYRNGGKGDKKLVYRTEIIRNTPPYPIFEGERYVGLNYKYHIIDRTHELLVLNEPLIIVDYQTDGSSSGMYRQYWNNPRGWSFYRKFEMEQDCGLKRRFMLCIHYVSSSIIAGNKAFLSESPKKFLTLCAIPFGCLLYLRIRRGVKNNIRLKVNQK